MDKKQEIEKLINQTLERFDFELPKDEYSAVANELADEIVKLFAIPDVSQQREQLAILALERISKAHSESFSAGVASEALYKIANCG